MLAKFWENYKYKYSNVEVLFIMHISTKMASAVGPLTLLEAAHRCQLLRSIPAERGGLEAQLPTT